MEQERNDLHSSDAGDSLGMNKPFVFNCPYLGTLEDFDTSLAYPAPANHCLRVDSPTAVDLSHQQDYCLTDRHPGCHVFQMASAATAEVEPAAPLIAPEKQKRRVSYFALPLILILILLAAIVWWPAPGTTIQESLVLGAQNDPEVGGGATLRGEPVSQPAQAEEAVEVTSEEAASVEAAPRETAPREAASAEAAPVEATSPDTDPDPAPSVSLNDESSDRAGKEQADTSTTETAGNRTAGNTQNPASSRPDTAAAPDQPAGTTTLTETNTETGAAGTQSTGVEAPVAVQTSARETSETSTASPSSNEENASNTAEEIVFDEVSDETEQVSVTDENSSEEESTSEEENASEEESTSESEDADEPTAVTTVDLPVISDDIPTSNTAPQASEPTNDPSGLVTLVGPVASTSLTLRDSPESINVLSVYQGPGSDSELLSLIDRRQFVTLLERDSGGNWLKVRLNSGVEGWINAAQSGVAAAVNTLPLEGGATTPAEPLPEQPTPAITSYPVIRSAFVDTGALNVRSGPGVQYEPVTIISSGELIGLIGRRALGPWVRIRLDSGLEGWVNSSLLTEAG